MKRTRLSRGNSSKRKDRLTLEKQVQQLSNERLVRYAGISEQEAKVNPALGKLKGLASAELEQRAKLLAVEKKGAGALVQKPKVSAKEKVQKALGYLRKGLDVWKKALTGELAEDLEVAISEIGMSDEEKKAFGKHVRELKQKEAEKERQEMEEFTFVEPVQETVEEPEPKPRKPMRDVEPENVYDIIDEENMAMEKERSAALHAKGNVHDWLKEGRNDFEKDRKLLGLDQERHHGHKSQKERGENAYDMINEGREFVAREQERVYGRRRK